MPSARPGPRALASATAVRRGSALPALAFVLVLQAALAAPAVAQIRGSERSVVSQTSDGTTVTVDYARPQLRGRGAAFPDIVGWEHVWTPGANEATRVTVSADVTVNDVALPEGTYSLWMVPRPGEWDVVFEPEERLYHTQPPEAHDGQIRFTVTPDATEEVEVLTFDFPRVRPDGMELRFRWGTVEIPLAVDVPPSRVLTLTEAEAAPYLGRFQVSPAGPPPPGVPEGAEIPSMGWEIEYDDQDRLHGRILDGPPMFAREFLLIPVAEHVFNPAWMQDGEILETEVDMYVEFVVEDGRAARLEVLGLEDRVMMRGERR